MEENSLTLDCELLCIIVNHGMAQKIMRTAKQQGIRGGTILLGHGTVRNKLLDFLVLNDVRREIILIAEKQDTVLRVSNILNQEFEFHKPHHGIAFTISIAKLCGIRGCSYIQPESEGEVTIMYKAIFTVVEKGKAAEVIETAEKAGSRGGTVMNARGSGAHETQKLFHMEIEPEKEIVLILAEESTADTIADAINQTMQIEDPGKGVMFILDVQNTFGLR